MLRFVEAIVNRQQSRCLRVQCWQCSRIGGHWPSDNLYSMYFLHFLAPLPPLLEPELQRALDNLLVNRFFWTSFFSYYLELFYANSLSIWVFVGVYVYYFIFFFFTVKWVRGFVVGCEGLLGEGLKAVCVLFVPVWWRGIMSSDLPNVKRQYLQRAILSWYHQ